MKQKNQNLIGIISAITSGIAFLAIKYLFSGEIDFLTSIIFMLTFGTTYILLHKFFGKK
ncbi:MAG: hypothetical protein ACKKL4_02035 [Patescibacteria group bacterium]